jgi:hypothetical protein
MKPWQQAEAKPVTIEASTLARQLANDEPKCANCAKWSSPAGEPVGACMHPRAFALDLPVHTTDLSVCSAWTKK